VVVYNKLIRDRIPQIMEAQGKTFTVLTLNSERYLQTLNEKLREEVTEYIADGSIGELADLAEVLYAILKAKGVSIEEFEAIRVQKRRERGGFDERLFLVSVDE
jgi:predicted house-cleaning noncanonical NTP pyrophosphatase (MazG superfamily)